MGALNRSTVLAGEGLPDRRPLVAGQDTGRARQLAWAEEACVVD